ncbi:MAG: hypothetical protein Q9212_001395 [Teloschistes hypoglaucus]
MALHREGSDESTTYIIFNALCFTSGGSLFGYSHEDGVFSSADTKVIPLGALTSPAPVTKQALANMNPHIMPIIPSPSTSPLRGFYLVIAALPLSFAVYKFSRSSDDSGDEASQPWFTRMIRRYDSWQRAFGERNALHTNMLEQAGHDRNLFHNSPRSEMIDLSFPEIFNTGSPYNVPAGHGANLDELIAHYKKKNAEQDAKSLYHIPLHRDRYRQYSIHILTMYTKYLLAGAAAVVAVAAQSSTSTAPIAFTSIPARVTAGSDVTIYWGGGDPNTPVTIFLRQGADENNLQTVGIVNGSATGTSAIWHVPKTIQNRNDYTYYIVQGLTPTPDTSNYSGRFGATGGVASSDASSPSTPATSTSAGNAGGAVVGGGAGSPTSASAGAQTAIASMNASMTTTVASGNATTTTVPLGGAGAVGTGAVGSGASGASGAGATGTAMVRNTTMSMATLSATSSSSSAAATTGGSGGASSTSSGSGGSSTKAPSSGGASVMMDAASFASPLALVLSAFAAVVYLG